MKLHSKRLLSIWDHHTYSAHKKKIKKPIDGLFIFQSLFSVEAFASRPAQNLTTQLAKRTADALLEKVRALRNDINQQHRKLINDCDSEDIRKIIVNEPIDVAVESRHYMPASVMLMKVFLSCDAYFAALYQARMEGELTETEMQHHRTNTTVQLDELLRNVHRTCLSFHKVRKEAEAKT